MSSDVLTVMRHSGMTSFQVRSIVLCMAALLIIGYDLSVIALAMPYIPADFFASDIQRGFVLSAALLGMTIGCFFIAPLADRFGRRTLIVTMLLVGCVSMAGCAISPDANLLLISRLFTGIAGGSMLSCLIVLVQEQASLRRRGTVFGIFTMGFSFGALLSGLAAITLLPLGLSWQSLFFVGSGAALVVAALALLFLPESVEYLIARESSDPSTQRKLDRIIAGLRNTEIDRLARPPVADSPAGRTGPRTLFSDGKYRITFLHWVALIGPSMTYFFVSTWTPQLLATETGDPRAGASIGLYLGLGTVLGSVCVALLAIRLSPFLFVWIAGACAGIGVIVLSASFSQLPAASAATVVVGTFFGITQAGVNSLVPALYAVNVRATAAGWLQGLGFLAGFVAPVLGGALLSIVTPAELVRFSVVPVLIGAIAACLLWMLRTRQQRALSAMAPEPVLGAAGGR